MAALKRENIMDDMIIISRKKTDVQSVIPLLPKAKAILEKYDYQLPVLSNQRYNSYLGEIKDICNIEKKLHTHLGRHTMATILINNGVDLPIIAKILGHSSTKITESIYAKVLDKTVQNNADKIQQAFAV
jgi:integrase